MESGTIVLLDVPAEDLRDCLRITALELRERGQLSDEQMTEVVRLLATHHNRSPDTLDHGVAVIHDRMRCACAPIQVLVRLTKSIDVGDDDEECRVRFVWILLSPAETHPHIAVVAEFSHVMGDAAVRTAAVAAASVGALEAIYLDARDDELRFAAHVPPELVPTGRIFGALKADIRRRLPHYAADFKDGLRFKSLASTLFLFFACLAPSVAFGGLLSVMTNGEIGVVEMLLSTGLCGVIYALFSGQPLTIIGCTGPVMIFMGIFYSVCESYGVPYLPTLAWVGLWTAAFLLLLVAIDGCSWIRFFTRFTDDTFAALISAIYIVEALKKLAGAWHGEDLQHDSALLSLLLGLGTFYVATNLSNFRKSPYLRRPVREFLADFGPTIAIFSMAIVAFSLDAVAIDTLSVPSTFGTTADRPWLVDIFAAPPWVRAAAAAPAGLLAILLYLDQNITVRLINSPGNRLRRGGGYHLDMTVIAVLVAVCSLFGLPWMVAATVRSLNHLRSLADVESDPVSGQDRITAVVETRVTGTAVNMLILGSLAALPLLQKVPMAVLFGLFLFMGVASMRGNQFFERARLWFMDPSRYPPTYYLRAVPRRAVHLYTAIQALSLVVLWMVKASAAGILFPLFIALLVPVRMAMKRLFLPEHLALLDAESEPEEEAYRELE
mgnify:CR=1 FL=1|jgi:mannitol/fructose-specific phosphotransferase system IIA component (Ntr-type)